MKKQFLIVGIGGIGVRAASFFAGQTHPFSAPAFSLAFDTDEGSLEGAFPAVPFSLCNGNTLEKTVKDLGEENIGYYFPCDPAQGRVEYGQATAMNRGANRFRMKAMVAFADFLHDAERRDALDAKLNEIMDTEEETETEVYTVASLAGGTGAALFMPISLYIARAFRQKGRCARFFALLTAPGILPAHADAVQQIKENANAYAALRELSAAMACQSDGPAAVPFRLGRKGDPYFGLLFPQTDSGTVQRPFARVYLMDKRPGVSTADAYISLTGEVLEALCVGAGVPKEETEDGQAEPYVGISLSELIYPLESISDYAAGKRVWEQNEKWIPLFAHADAAARGTRDRIPYAFHFLEALAEKSEDIGILFPALRLTGRDETDYDRDMSGQILAALHAACRYEEEKKTQDVFAEEKESLSAHTFRFPFFAGAKAKREKRAAFSHLLSSVVSRYETISDTCASSFAEAVSAALDAQERAVFSDAFLPASLPPLAAMIRLCSLRVAVEDALRDAKIRRPGLGEEEKAYLRDLAGCFAFSAQVYSAFGEDEKIYTLSWNEGEYENGDRDPDKDSPAVLSQLEKGLLPVYTEWEKMRFSASLALLAVRLDERIAGYASFLSAMAHEQEEQKEELVYLKQSKSTGSGFVFYVGAGAESKEKTAASYLQENPVAEAATADPEIGGAVRTAIAEKRTGREEMRALARKAFAGQTEKEAAAFFASETYKALAEKDMLSFLTEENGPALLADFLGAALPLLPMEEGRLHNGHAPGTRFSTLLLPPEKVKTAQWETGVPEDAEEKTQNAQKQAYLTALFTRAACFDAGFTLDVPLRAHRLRAVGCRTDFVPADLSSAGECGRNAAWYVDYLKAEANSQKYSTAMWCPYSSIAFSRGGALPYLDENMNEIAVKQAAKAFLFVFLSGDFRIGEDETEDGEKKTALFRVAAGQATCLRADGEAVTPEDCAALISYLRGSDSRRVALSDGYDALLERECRALPPVELFFAEKAGPARAVASTLFMRVLRENVFRLADTEEKYQGVPLALLLYNWENRDGGQDSTGIRRAVYDTVFLSLEHLCEAASIGCDRAFTDSLIRYAVGRMTEKVPQGCALRFAREAGRYGITLPARNAEENGTVTQEYKGPEGRMP